MYQKVHQWSMKMLAIGLLVVCMPFYNTCAAQKHIPRSRNTIRFRDYHELGVDLSLGILKLCNWSFGSVYGYAWAQRGNAWWMFGIGAKYNLKRDYLRYSNTVIIVEPSLHIPISFNLLEITPEWGTGFLFTSSAMGVGYESVVALSSRYFEVGQAAQNSLKAIPDLSRFSGNLFLSYKATTYWGIYLGVLLRCPIEQLGSLLRAPNRHTANQHVDKKDIHEFRFNTTPLIECSIGLDIIHLSED